MALRLEVFDSHERDTNKQTIVLDSVSLEEAKLASYDVGYSQGWEDALSTQSSESSKLQLELARNLQGLSFTFTEARNHVLKGFDPLMAEIVNKLLPHMVRDLLGPAILEILKPISKGMADSPITLVASPLARDKIQKMVNENADLPIVVVEEPSLTEGQVYLRLGEAESHVNLDRAVAEISMLIRSFFELPNEE
jgi:flagellar biosynthesis/type III secretory pathway protein FliH